MPDVREATRRWLAGPFSFAAPPGFPRVAAPEPRAFALSAYPVTSDRLWVRVSEHPLMAARLGGDALPEAMRRAAEPLKLDPTRLRAAAQATSLLDRPALRADIAVPDTPGWAGLAGGILVARGPDAQVWTFAYRSSVEVGPRLREAFDALLASVAACDPPASEEALQAQWEGQAERHAALARELGEPEGEADYASLTLEAARAEFLRRYAFAAGDAADPALLTEAIGLTEDADAGCPPGASRVGGAPDVPEGAWPTDARGLRLAFLAQLDLAEVANLPGAPPGLPPDGTLAVFADGDAPDVTILHVPAGTPTAGADLRRGDLEAWFEVERALEAMPDDPPPGPQPQAEGDAVTLTVLPDGTLRFAHTDDPAWAKDAPGRVFVPVADHRWVSADAARLRPRRVLSFDLAGALARIEAMGQGSADAVDEEADALASAFGGDGSAPVHQVGGTLYDGHDGAHGQAAEAAGGAPSDWHVLLALRPGGACAREYGDANTLAVMMRAEDIAARRWERAVCVPA